MFGFGQQNQENVGEDVYIEVSVSLKTLYLGKTLRVHHKKQILCPHCGGSGADRPEDKRECGRCRGKGMIITSKQVAPGFVTRQQSPCESCDGKGFRITSTCHECGGHKVKAGSDSFMLMIEPGMPDGYEIRGFEREGHQAPEMIPGDIIFRLRTLSDPTVKREGDDLHVEMHISLLESLLGFERDYIHFDGHGVPIKREGVTPYGHVEKVASEGMPKFDPLYSSEDGNGDLYVTFVVDFPLQVDEKHHSALKEIFSA